MHSRRLLKLVPVPAGCLPQSSLIPSLHLRRTPFMRLPLILPPQNTPRPSLMHTYSHCQDVIPVIGLLDDLLIVPALLALAVW